MNWVVRITVVFTTFHISKLILGKSLPIYLIVQRDLRNFSQVLKYKREHFEPYKMMWFGIQYSVRELLCSLLRVKFYSLKIIISTSNLILI